MRRLEAKKKLSFVETEEGDEGLASPARPESSGGERRGPANAAGVAGAEPVVVVEKGRPGGAPASPAPRSPFFSPTKKARQATLFECLSPKKAATPSQPETVDLCTPQK